MKKVMVVGCPGAGKSVFSRALSARTGLPVVHLDMLFHRPDKTERSHAEFDAALAKAMAAPAYILDGNYTRTLEIRLQACDTVFFLDYPLPLCLAGAEGRIGQKRSDFPYIEEKMDEDFRQYILDFPQKHLFRVRAALDAVAGEKRIVTFFSRAEADAFLSALPSAGAEQTGSPS